MSIYNLFRTLVLKTIKKLPLGGVEGLALLAIVSCGTQKTAVDKSSTAGLTKVEDNTAQKKLAYVKKVSANAVAVQNIVSKIDFNINAQGHDITVDGKLQMRKDQVIRITLSPLGLMEVGRVEFAPDYVLLVDRINKEYVRATYNDLDFLKNNGLDFYSLQALFWNELFVPGVQKQTDVSMQKFDVDLANGDFHDVTLKSGQLNYTWTTNDADQLITSTKMEYGKNTSSASTATWTYSDFKTVGAKKFPATNRLSFRSTSLSSPAKVVISLGKISNDSDWDVKTSVSSSYKQVKAEDVLKKLMSM